MSGHQTATIEDTVFFWFAANDTSGSGGDGASPLFDVREAGAAADAIPLLSGTPTLLSHANYPAGCHEIAVAATTGNGFAADDTFAVFCTLAVDSQNPTGFVGSCTLTPLAKASEVTSVRMAVLTDWIDGGRLDLLLDAIKVPTDKMVFTVANQLDVNVQYWLDVVVATALQTAADVRTEMDSNSTQLAAIVGDTNELQVDWVNGGRLDLLLDAIPTTAMRGTDNAALASEVTAARMATLTDWINGGRLDLLLDAVKSTTDKFVFTNANEVDANTKSINDAEVVGDGNATPWDGV